ncbi:ParB N-terminal domain-containing protein [Pelagibacterium sp. 26DY04]|uniref:DNA N-6-adenine-methyltransferase n=1 Tax=Pelagibacterium sp. 26DY04 TaxID=2967130 RepID=UPI0028169C98|nr:DNA N-6-adenine-methyltransferase [Pelagibacterium sp. 26DY04]WMT88666.1 ParB N-terminal domain-containing protein [Pelagibacterium sp. 26DY04]
MSQVDTRFIDDVREEVRAEQRQKRDAAQNYRSGKISDLLIDHIHVPVGRRAVDGSRAEELAKSISEVGLLSPVIVARRDGIEVDGDILDNVPVLVAGAHRIEAMKALGHTFIRCQEIDADEIDAELIEISENLHRAELTALQRSEQIARWIELTTARREAGEISRQPDAKPGRPEGGVRAAARELGLSEPDARRAVKVAGLSAEAKAAAVDAGLDNNRTALLAAAKEPEPEKQVAVLVGRTIVAANENAPGPNTYRTNFTGDNEWYTPARYIELARKVMGSIDVDPASNDHAQKTVRAETYYTAETNGLDKDWRGKVWMNPPYSQPEIVHFIDKLVEEYQSGRCTEAIVLTNNSTDTGWFGTLFEHAVAICFTTGRIRFESPKGEKAAPVMGQAFCYFGTKPERFAEVFAEIGNVVMPARQTQAAGQAA